MFKKSKKKSFDEMTITEKDAEIKRLEKEIKRKKILYKIAIPLTIISMISTVVYALMFVLMCTEYLDPKNDVIAGATFVLWIISFATMLINVHVFVPIYWVRFIRSAYGNISEHQTGELVIDLIIGGIFVSVPTAFVLVATLFVPGFYCLKRTLDLKKSIAESTSKIEFYKSKIYPYDGDFELISAYMM